MILKENEKAYLDAYPELEDATYGLYANHLLTPIWKELEKAGYRSFGEVKEDDYLIAECLNFRNSIEKEKWGSGDGDQCSRIFWIVIENEQQKQIGTLLYEMFHSHLQFKVPDAPKITALKDVERKQITTTILRMKEKESET